MAEAYARKVCLIETLAEEYPDAGEPPVEAAEEWSEIDIRRWFEPKGRADMGPTRQPGGSRSIEELGESRLLSEEEGARVQLHQMNNTPDKYRTVALSAGIPHRPDGLFPPECPVLASLLADGYEAFQKHLSDGRSENSLVLASWAVGNSAAKAGLDLRYFYKRGTPYGSVAGAVRFGQAAKIGSDFDIGIHGGAIETALDEATAELCKIEVAPIASTVEATFKIKKALLPGVTYRIHCNIKEVKGFRIWVSGRIESPADDGVMATCDAQLVDMAKFMALQKR